jgi:hypothetical protein
MSMGCTRAEAESKVIPKSKKQAQTWTLKKHKR